MRIKNKSFVGKKINNILISECFRENNRTFFHCTCFCGKIFNVRADSIRKGTTKSCGCLTGQLIAKKTTKNNNANQINSLYKNYQYNAERRKLSFNLLLNEFLGFISQDCHYCGIFPQNKWFAGKNRKNYFVKPIIYNGIDRLDSNKGYDIANVVPSCFICNRGKNSLPYEDFLNWIYRTVKFQKEFNNYSLIKSELNNNIIKPLEGKKKGDEKDILSLTKRDTLFSGEVFGYLTILEKAEYGKGLRGYKCLCVCGKIAYRRKDLLLKGRVKSCGCKKGLLNSIKTTKPGGESQFRYLFARYRADAKKRNINFLLSFDDFKLIIIKECSYCGAAPRQFNLQSFGSKNYNTIPIYYNGIDRIDSNKCYCIENCTSCCKICNRVKHNLSYEDFTIYIDRLVRKYSSNE